MKKSFDIIPETEPKRNMQPSEAFLTGKKFEEHPISFSQMINNDESDQSAKSIFRQSNQKSTHKSHHHTLTYQSNVMGFRK